MTQSTNFFGICPDRPNSTYAIREESGDLYCPACATVALPFSTLDQGHLIVLGRDGMPITNLIREDVTDHESACIGHCARCSSDLRCGFCAICDSCQSNTNPESMMSVQSGEMVCESCSDSYYGMCADCDELALLSELQEIRTYRGYKSVCEGCRESGEYYSCTNCEEWITGDDSYSPEAGDGIYCESCYGELFGICEECEETFTTEQLVDTSTDDGWRVLCSDCQVNLSDGGTGEITDRQRDMLRRSDGFCDCEECDTLGTGQTISDPICRTYRALVSVS